MSTDVEHTAEKERIIARLSDVLSNYDVIEWDGVYQIIIKRRMERGHLR